MERYSRTSPNVFYCYQIILNETSFYIIFTHNPVNDLSDKFQRNLTDLHIWPLKYYFGLGNPILSEPDGSGRVDANCLCYVLGFDACGAGSILSDFSQKFKIF